MSEGDFYAISAGLVWSFGVILMRISGFHIQPVALTIFKSGMATMFFAMALPVLNEPFVQSLPPEAYLRLVVSGILGITIADTMFAAALNRLGASLQALADCIYSPAIAGIGFLMFEEYLGKWELLGGILVVAGVAVGMRMTAEVHSRKDLVMGVILASGAHIIMAVGILMVRDLIREESLSIVWISGVRFFAATVTLVGLSLFRMPAREVFMGFTRRDTWKTTIPMSFLGPFVATMLWTAGFKHVAAGRAAIYNQLSTVFILLLAVLILKERMTKRKLTGIALAVCGALLVALQN
jgi:drug/metabolite transporter (DMT)-like permease